MLGPHFPPACTCPGSEHSPPLDLLCPMGTRHLLWGKGRCSEQALGILDSNPGSGAWITQCRSMLLSSVSLVVQLYYSRDSEGRQSPGWVIRKVWRWRRPVVVGVLSREGEGAVMGQTSGMPLWPSLFSCFSDFTYCHLYHMYAFGVLDATEHSTCIISCQGALIVLIGVTIVSGNKI